MKKLTYKAKLNRKFPDHLKLAGVADLYKKINPLEKSIMNQLVFYSEYKKY